MTRHLNDATPVIAGLPDALGTQTSRTPSRAQSQHLLQREARNHPVAALSWSGQ